MGKDTGCMTAQLPGFQTSQAKKGKLQYSLMGVFGMDAILATRNRKQMWTIGETRYYKTRKGEAS